MMLDWGALVTGETAPEEGKTGHDLGHCPKHAPSLSGDMGRTESSNGAGFRGNAPSAPNAPIEKQEEEEKITESGAVGVAAPSNLCAEFSVSSIAVCLLVAYWEKVGRDADELAGALAGLRSMQPGEQERCWARACIDVGIDGWRVIHQQSNGEGQECMGCKHLSTRVASLPHTRRRYFWSCDLHYQVREHYQGGERVVIAPPDCQSWSRWQR